VQGNGTSYRTNDYEFTDENPADGINYYRLKQVDFDGKFEYSKVVSARFGGAVGQAHLQPSVATDEVMLKFQSAAEQDGSVSIFDLNGKLVKKLVFEAETTEMQIPIYDLPNGSYFVKMEDGRTAQTLKFVKK
jgi:hypothetical protein